MIAFSCPQCGLKLKVKAEFAGRQASCPTCKHRLVVPPPDRTIVAGERIDGLLSSLHRAGIDAGVTLITDAPGNSSRLQRPVRELLERQGKAADRYLLEGEIARGGMGAVLRAVDRDIRREVAVKYLLDQSDLRRKARFVEEAQITGQLEHPNIVPIHELGIDEQKRLFFSMKMVKGRSLAQALDGLREKDRATERQFTLGRLLGVLVNVCHALGYAHSRGVIHRDLKPANVMLGDFGEVYVMDWGLAKVLASVEASARRGEENPETSPRRADASTLAPNKSSKVVVSRDGEADLTQDGAVLGTPAYMPPEQALGHVAALDARSDVYSLGAILYEILTLLPPVDKEGGYLSTLMRVSQGEIALPEVRAPERAHAGKIPRELAAVAMKALSRDPAGRYPTVEALRQDIERFLEGRSVSAKADTTREMLWKLVRRNKAVSAASVVFLFLLMVAFGFTLKNHLAYRAEQKEKERRMKQAVPAFVRAAQLAVSKGQLTDAMTQVEAALEYDRDYPEAHLLKGQLLIVGRDFSAARDELHLYLKQKPQDRAAGKLADLCRQARANDDHTLLAFIEEFTEQGALALADGMAGENTTRLRDRLLATYQKRINKVWPGLGVFLGVPPSGTGLYLDMGSYNTHLKVTKKAEVTDLSPLRGMALTSLALLGCDQVRDLSPLAGMKLRRLDLMGCTQVRDLSPLKDMPLEWLRIAYNHQIKDLSPLRGMPLKDLQIAECYQVRDLAPLAGLKLTSLELTNCREVTDLSPLKGMPLTRLWLSRCRAVRDLSPLNGMKLTDLDVSYCGGAQDLAPLRGMPLRRLCVPGYDRRKDLALIRELPVTELDLSESQIADLSPLRGTKLVQLTVSQCPVTDLSPLRGMPLSYLGSGGCQKVTDLAPLKGLKLSTVYLNGTTVTDVSPLEGMELTHILLPYTARGMQGLRRIRTLVHINNMQAANWWKRYDAGEFMERYKP